MLEVKEKFCFLPSFHAILHSSSMYIIFSLSSSSFFFLPFIHIVWKLLLFLPFIYIYFFLIESLWMVSRRLEMIMTMVNKKRNISFFLHGVRHATLSIGMIFFFLVQRRVNIHNNNNVMACKKKYIFFMLFLSFRSS